MTRYDLQTLIDRAELTDLTHRLGRALDEHRFADLEQILTEDCVGVTPGGAQTGRAALIGQAARNHQDYERLTHEFSSVLVDVDGDTAAIRAIVTGTFGHADDPTPVRQQRGLYQVKAVRTPDGWRISELNALTKFRLEAPAPATA